VWESRDFWSRPKYLIPGLYVTSRQHFSFLCTIQPPNVATASQRCRRTEIKRYGSAGGLRSGAVYARIRIVGFIGRFNFVSGKPVEMSNFFYLHVFIGAGSYFLACVSIELRTLKIILKDKSIKRTSENMYVVEI
jgi:hypothetical protein